MKFDYAKFGVSNLFFSKVIEEKPLGMVKADIKLNCLSSDIKVQEKLERKPLTFS